jgi:hypothetical protein
MWTQAGKGQKQVHQILPNSLSNEVANNTAIINVHPRPIGVENPGNSDLYRHCMIAISMENHHHSYHETKKGYETIIEV